MQDKECAEMIRLNAGWPQHECNRSRVRPCSFSFPRRFECYATHVPVAVCEHHILEPTRTESGSKGIYLKCLHTLIYEHMYGSKVYIHSNSE